MRIVVTGAAGQLGSAIVRRLGRVHDVTALGRAELDLTRHDAVVGAILRSCPDAIVNCAAYNAVDAAEDDATGALAVNAFAVRSLARAAADAGATLVHYGTDFVFDGRAEAPYTESDSPAPQSVYGQSKLLGEYFARDAPSHYVLRVESLFGGTHPKSSIDRIIDAIVTGHEARVFVDRVVSPSYVEDVAAATEALLAGSADPGVYHCVNSGHATWFELGQAIAQALGLEARLVGTRVADVPMRAPRPTYCALSNAKLAAAGITMPAWQDAIARHVAVRRRAPDGPQG